MLRAEQVSDAIRRGVNAKISDGHNLYLVVKNGRGFWVYQYRDGAVIRSKGLGSAANVTPAQARRARENFAVALRSGVAAKGLGIGTTEARGRQSLPGVPTSFSLELDMAHDIPPIWRRTWIRYFSFRLMPLLYLT